METEKTNISKCCNVQVEYIYDDKSDGYICSKCHKTCEVEEVCALCLGTGEVSTMEPVYPGEPHMADIGTRTCLCRLKEADDTDDDS